MIFLDLWGRKLGIPLKEYRTMPVGELTDLINAYHIIHGAEERETPNETTIPAKNKYEDMIAESSIPNLK